MKYERKKKWSCGQISLYNFGLNNGKKDFLKCRIFIYTDNKQLGDIIQDSTYRKRSQLYINIKGMEKLGREERGEKKK